MSVSFARGVCSDVVCDNAPVTILFFGGLGLIVGSFLNVVIAREGTDEGIRGRSHCRACRHELSPRDLVPVLSWLALRGTCRYCTHAISLQYPLVELLTAVLFIGVGLAPLLLFSKMLALVIVSLAVSIAIYDLKHKLMPDLWNYAFATCALIYSGLSVSSGTDLWQIIFAGPLCAFPLWSLWAFSGGRWMGLGDVKFALGIGWLLGPFLGFIALLGAFVLGAVVSVCVLLPLPYYARIGEEIRRFTRAPMVSVSLFVRVLRRKVISVAGSDSHTFIPNDSKKTKTPLISGFTMKSEVPFGPFLIVSCIALWFLNVYGVALPFL